MENYADETRKVHNKVNSSPPGVSYMRWWIASALVRKMACRMFGANPLPKPMLVYCLLDPWEQSSVKFESKYNFFIHENAFENVVCEMAAIRSRKWINIGRTDEQQNIHNYENTTTQLPAH